jgi:hypothetical protein
VHDACDLTWEMFRLIRERPRDDPDKPSLIVKRLESIAKLLNSIKPPGIADRKNAPTTNDLKLLSAMKALGAINQEKRTTRSKIASKANSGHHGSRHNKDSFKHLKSLGLIDSVRNGGTWLTDRGISLASG